MGIIFNAKTTYLELPETMYAKVEPEKFSNPKMLFWNEQLAQDLGLAAKNSKDLLNILSFKKKEQQPNSIAQAYAGHQFGHFNILGDGRAILLGEQISTNEQRFDVQLKGSGHTPYSRRGDGKATLYSMLREYIISEGMHGLNIPTTRSLAVVATGDKVYRETVQNGAVLARIASSHIRVGTFEFVARQNSIDALKILTDYSIKRHYPELLNNTNSNTLYLDFFKKVMARQVDTIVNWIRVGFIHGVMNTDNITISGETIDYGPCAFMNKYDPQTVYSSIDTKGRYAFGNQGQILLWNLARFAEALLPLFDPNKEKALAVGQQLIDSYEELFSSCYHQMMKEKLGLLGDEKEDYKLINEFLNWMLKAKADYTNTFLRLEQELSPNHSNLKFDEKSLDELNDFLINWQERVSKNKMEALAMMQKSNPRIIPRNHKVEEAIVTASVKKDYTKFNALLNVTTNPYNKNVIDSQFTQPPENEDDYQTYCGT